MFSVIGCVCLIKQTYGKWNDNPVIVSFARHSTPLWTLPLPAVTICPEIKYKRNLFNLTNVKDTLNVTDPILINYQNALFPICPESYPISSDENPNFSSTLRFLAVPLNEVFALVNWRGIESDYGDVFKEILTDDGICYTYNMLNYKELVHDVIDSSLKYPKHEKYSTNWSLQDGYSVFEETIYPTRVLGSGLKAGIEIRLIAMKDDLDYKCKGPIQGFKMVLHSPTDWPQFSKQYYRIPLKKEVIMTVEPKVIQTSENLRKYKPKIRQCFFDGERSLIFFKIYTQSNCKLECLSNFTVKYCGCVRLGSPHDNITQVCGYTMQTCTGNAENMFISSTWNPNLKSKDQEDDCNCLPACNSLSYHAASSYGVYYYNEFFESVGIKFDENK